MLCIIAHTDLSYVLEYLSHMLSIVIMVNVPPTLSFIISVNIRNENVNFVLNAS